MPIKIVSTFIILMFAVHLRGFWLSEGISVNVSQTMSEIFENSTLVMNSYLDNLNKTIPSGFFTFLSGLLLFKYGTKYIEDQKQLSSFYEKYIKLKNDIDKNKKDMLLNSKNKNENFKSDLNKMADLFISYTNLLYEEMLANENKRVVVLLENKWISSFNNEIADWEKLFQKIFQTSYQKDKSPFKIFESNIRIKSEIRKTSLIKTETLNINFIFFNKKTHLHTNTKHTINLILTPILKKLITFKHKRKDVFANTVKSNKIEDYYNSLKIKKRQKDRMLNSHNELQIKFRERFADFLNNHIKNDSSKNDKIKDIVIALREICDPISNIETLKQYSNTLKESITSLENLTKIEDLSKDSKAA